MRQSEPTFSPEPRHITVARTARYYVIGDQPAGPRRELWIVVHGYGQLAARFLRHFVALADGDRVIVAPEGLSRFYLEHPGRAGTANNRVGATWMTREDREAEITDHVAYLVALVDRILEAMPGPRPAVHLLGFSQGVATVTRWITRGRIRADRLVLWAGRVPADLFPLDAYHPLRRLQIDVVTGETDELATPAVLEEPRALFADAGLRPRMHRYAGGHRLHAETLHASAALGADA